MKTILVIEDEQILREPICDLLQAEGFNVIGAALGRQGIQLAEAQPPDLILCDVTLPDVDGYSILATLQQNPLTRTIPFIFLTARGARADLRRGMNLGADDYLVKPCSAEDLLGAITSRFNRQEALLTQSQQQLDALRNNIASSLPHELHTPLNGILLFAEILIDEYASIDRNEILEVAKGIHHSATRLYRLIQNFLCYAQLEVAANDPERCAALCQGETSYGDARIAEVATRIAIQADREADLVLKLQNGSLRMSDTRLQKIMEELIDNAFKFSQPGTPVQVTSEVSEQVVIVHIADQGRGMTAEQIASLGAYMQFDRRFYEQQGAGLGLIIAKRMLELHGGQLSIESIPGQQTTIHVTIPQAKSKQAWSAA